ncbi:hypothetical protein LPJ57_003227 [Coemansia sp. RSA 486]|nr:hypothetical protein LPJ57_003227 [Coemansia sp. RSA 486]KAJ2237223.1 hypothetical protein IWW45_001161 [Coemansia sp. RSA 485]
MASSDFEGPSTVAAAATPSSTARAACAWASCHSEFASFHQLAAHLSKDHIGTDANRPPVCEWRHCALAGSPMSSRYNLITHIKTHTGDRSFLCPFDACDKVYKRTDFLKRHIETHAAAAAASTPAPDPNAAEANHPSSARRPKRRYRRPQASAPAAADANSDNESIDNHEAAYANDRASPTDAPSLRARSRPKRKSRRAYASDASSNRSSNSDADSASDSDNQYEEQRRLFASGLLDSAPESEQLVTMLQAQLDYISNQVDDRKEKLARAKVKIRRLRMENDILLDTLTRI